jgi:hypothetical protein
MCYYLSSNCLGKLFFWGVCVGGGGCYVLLGLYLLAVVYVDSKLNIYIGDHDCVC